MKRTKMQKGITLIALIITIIILLILAVVTIGSIKNSNIITYAQNASTDYEKAKNDEEGIISNYETTIKENLPGVDKVTYKEGVPIPAGFYYVTGTKDTGLVISDDKSDEYKADGKDGNQFVWVPVDDINTMVMCKSKTASDQCSIKLNEAKTELLCETHSNSTDICGKLYSSVYNDYINSSRTNQEYTNGNKEPYNTTGETNTTYQAEFNEMAVSVAKNGGFYVGRYETSMSGTMPQSKYGETTATTAVNSANTWYGLYALNKGYSTNSVKSSMIWGSQYDAMMIWMGNDATSFDTSKKNTDFPKRRTGYVSTDVIRNVYDLGGNSQEWTLEAFGTGSRVVRSR